MTGRSDRLNKLAAALARAQAQIQPAHADGIGLVGDDADPRAYRYATLTSVWQAIRGALSRNGLSVVQTCQPSEAGELRLVTTLLHTSGQWISGTAVLPLAAQTPQAYGSALTYARRYGLTAIVGLCVDQDDDGAAGSRQPDLASRGSADGANQGDSAASNGSGAWWKVPWNKADPTHLKAFARAYARAKGVDSVDREDIRRDFGIEGRLVDHFGDTPLGEIVARARKQHSKRAAPGTAPSDDGRLAHETEAA